MADPFQLIIPDAGNAAAEGRQVAEGLRLPWLTRLLAELAPLPLQPQDPEDISSPFEHALARAVGLAGSGGRYPWGAWRAQRAGLEPGTQAWALITPCHWQVGTDHVRMDDPQGLQLQAEESQTLLRAMEPFFQEDGIVLQAITPGSWLAQGEMFRNLATASPERLRGQTIDAWMPPDPKLRRLQSEMQMLLYTHPVNDARAERGLAPVNSFWISGCGALPSGTVPAATDPTVVEGLRDAALREDWQAWGTAWQQIDAEHCAALHARLQQGQPVQLTLCGARASQTFVSQPRSALQKMAQWFRRPRVADTLGAL